MPEEPKPSLDPSEAKKKRLAELEVKITECRQAPVAIGRHFKAIRLEIFADNEDEFVAYAKQVWGYGRAYALRLIQVSEVLDGALETLEQSTHVDRDVAAKAKEWHNAQAILTFGAVPSEHHAKVLTEIFRSPCGAKGPTSVAVEIANAKAQGREPEIIADERTVRQRKAVEKIQAVIAHLHDRKKEVDRVAAVSTLEDALGLLQVNKPQPLTGGS